MAALDSGTVATSRAYLSIYAAFRLARILLDVKERFKSRIKARSPPAKPLTIYHRDTFKDNAYGEITRALNIRSRSGTLVHPRCRRKHAHGENLELPTLLQKLDSHTNSSHDKISSIAAQDQRFLEYDPQRATAMNDASMLSHILELTTLLLDRLEASPGNHTTHHRKINHGDCDYLKCEKFIANLQHLLRCLQQAILEALIQNTLKLIDADILHWHHNWQQRRGDREGWFAEWPNGQPPLNTTWPWNVKPSLVVIWGVCWMFYDHENQVAHIDHHNHHPNGWMTTHAASRQEGQPNVGVWTGHQTSRASAGLSQSPNTAGDWCYFNNTSNEAWLPGGRDRVTSSDSDSYYAESQDPTARALSLNHQYSLPSHPSDYTLNTLADTTLLPLWPIYTVASPWPSGLEEQEQQQQQQHQQQHQEPPPTLSTTPQQQSPDELFVSQPQQQHKQHQTPDLTLEDLQLEVPTPDMTLYLPSPHSDVSTEAPSTCISAFPISPILPPYPVASSSPRGSRRSSMEPRNEEGLLYCPHRDCVNESRIFQRKCEYQKHMDKHNRPYVCDEPGCEKIQGFTYSGGLLRHQREVHRQHGGPKASYMCPHRDCKRSTGTGFSRKENLNEHLRRVHRGVSHERDQVQPAATALVSGSTFQRLGSEKGSRKRRKVNDDEDEDDEDEIDAVNESRDLRKQVRKLRKEVQEKDERLKKLEQAVETLSGGRLPASA